MEGEGGTGGEMEGERASRCRYKLIFEIFLYMNNVNLRRS